MVAKAELLASIPTILPGSTMFREIRPVKGAFTIQYERSILARLNWLRASS